MHQFQRPSVARGSAIPLMVQFLSRPNPVCYRSVTILDVN
jgi:hypothetical protein